jgi:CRISPR system Cascade subunit CasC
MHIQLHSLTSLPVHVPNRGADGLAKRAVYGGHERQRISYQASQYALRHSTAMADLERVAGLGHTTRTALVAERIIHPALVDAGIADVETWTRTVMALWRKEEKESKSEGSEEQKAAPLIVGEQEARLLTAIARACVEGGVAPTDLRKLVEKARPPKGTPEAVVSAIEALKTARGSAGLDGALFGRMATGIAVATVDRCVRISDALTTHAITPVADFFLLTPVK